MSIFKQQSKNAIIVDAGSFSTRIGMASDPCCISVLPNEPGTDGSIVKPYALIKQILSVQQLNKLKEDKDIPLVFTFSKSCSFKKLHELAEEAFEHFETLSFLPQEQASVFYSNRSHGVFVDVGFNSTRIFGTFDGTFTDTKKIGWNLQEIDHQVMNFMQLDEIAFQPQKMKQFMVLDNIQHKQLILPTSILADSPIPADYRVLMYEPPGLLIKAIKDTCQEILQFTKDVDIVMCGNGSLLPGLCNRIQSECSNQVIASRDRGNHQFIGASTWVGSWSADTYQCYSKEDLEDYGESLFEKKAW
uniref:Actin-related protein n=1 Tax=Trepomonas sp. PC1 TaxID=1076344 RepID=A0A146KES2_9EUKA|eukprot:JAP93931.1 Actin-related protein [Trepomonas sp. PC1]